MQETDRISVSELFALFAFRFYTIRVQIVIMASEVTKRTEDEVRAAGVLFGSIDYAVNLFQKSIGYTSPDIRRTVFSGHNGAHEKRAIISW